MSEAAVWTDLELAFFASAPPDDPEPVAEPESFDDLLEPRAPRWERLGALWAVIAAVCAFRQ